MFEPPFMPHDRMVAVWDKSGISVSNRSRGLKADSRAYSRALSGSLRENAGACSVQARILLVGRNRGCTSTI